MHLRDCYDVLGVNADATAGDIKRAFRRLALQHHPDRNPLDIAAAEAKFKEISEAYEVLGDEEARWRYDNLARLTDHSSWTTGAGVVSDEMDGMSEILRRLAGLGFVVRGAGWGKSGGCGRRRGGQCWRQQGRDSG